MRVLATFLLLLLATPLAAQELPRLQCKATQDNVCARGTCTPRAETPSMTVTSTPRQVRHCQQRGGEERCSVYAAEDINTAGTVARLSHREGPRPPTDMVLTIALTASHGFVMTGASGGLTLVLAGTCEAAP